MKVVILAGGRGTRMRPLTDHIPKPLVTINGVPIIRVLMDFLVSRGYKDFVICIGYKGELVRRFFENSELDFDITYIDSGEDTDIIDRILDCKNVVSGRFLVCYGDAIANVDIPGLLNFHDSHGGLVTLTVFKMRAPFGLVYSNHDGLVHAFKEKPILNHWMNIGFMVFEKKALDLASGDSWLEFLDELTLKRKLYCFKHTGLHYTFNTEAEREEVEQNFDRFYRAIIKDER